MERECPYCQKIFSYSNNAQKYCSPEHMKSAGYRRHLEQRRLESRLREKRRRKPCPVCGKLITYNAKTCVQHATYNLHREGSSNWKGGRHPTAGGYIVVWNPKHPRANGGYIWEHILLWEQANGKELPRGWVIHHLNGIRDDNRLINLVALPDKKHRHILAAKAKRIQQLEGLLRQQGLLL